ELTENYYYVTQHFIAGDMQDPADLKNKPWLLSIRSDRDFQVFLRSIEMHNKYQNVFVDGHLPIHQLLDTYREYSDYLPSWPNVVNIKTTNNLSSQDCTHESAPLERVFDTVMDFFKGPTAWKSRPGLAVGETDFFSLFFCNPETYQ
ncbi:MAG: hypothetical protein CL677_00710, partial [Bdellovibrionaceae bacterium]|nr:hypothetical protein [Pseudobdellovibrionaceae bacterium]